MKKTILLLATMAVMTTACTNDETLEVTTPQAITFSNVFIDNATRAAIDNSYSNTNMFQAFDVYGTITNSKNETANLFKQEKVEKKGTDWSYDEANTQYWIPGNTYNFTAIVNGNEESVTEVETDDNGMPTIIKVNDASTQKDILFAKSEPIEYKSGDEVNPVSFTFSHLMAKAKITVENVIPHDNGYGYKVESVTFKNTAKVGQYIIGEGWKYLDTKYDLFFGNVAKESDKEDVQASIISKNDKFEANKELLIIPESKKCIDIAFNQYLYKYDQASQEYILIETKSIKVRSQEIDIKPGHAYNFYIKLGEPGEPIKFTVADEGIIGWETNSDVETKNNN